MNALRNRVQLIGHLGMDPEVKTFDKDKKLTRVSIATNEVYYNAKNERIEETQWHNVVMWGKTADIAEKYLKKGQEIALEGKLVNKSWETKEGEKRYSTEINVSEFVMLGKKEAAA
ncbi:MAG: single-stranded DNA-binding protein [Salibacteraceae bacterium]